MSVDHHERIKGVVKNALKEAAVGEAFGFAVSTAAFWPFLDSQGQIIGQGIAWFVTVSIRDTSVGEPDIYNGYPVPGMLPDDEDFRVCAQGLLEQCRKQRDNKNGLVLAQGPSMSLKDRPK